MSEGDVIELNQDLPGQILLAAAQSYIDRPDNRRQQLRCPAILPCFVTPIDEFDNPIAKPLPGVTIDISTGGMGLFLAQEIKPQLILISIARIDDQPLKLIAEVACCIETGNVFRLGAKLVRKLQP